VAAASIHGRAAEVIAEQHGKIVAHVAAAVDGRDPEGVHDMRVATRRLRAALKLFAPWIEQDALDRVAPAVRSLTRALGAVRELDVLRLRLAELARHARPERALALEHVDARLARRRSRARAKMMARFAKVDLDRLDGRLKRLASQLERSALATSKASAPDASPATETNGAAPGGPRHDGPLGELLAEVAPTLVEEARQVSEPTIPETVGTRQSAEALHVVRIAAKKLRYALEILAPHLGDPGSEAVRRLKALQDKLGDFHDDTVLDETLHAAVVRATERGRPLLAAELKRLRAARRRALTRDERAVRGAIARLHEHGFVELVEGAIAATGGEIALPDDTATPTPGA